MASMWRKTMLYLGLGPDDEYEEDGYVDETAQPQPAAQPTRTREPAPARAPAAAPAARPRPAGSSRPVTRQPAPATDADAEPSSVRTLPAQPQPEPAAPKPRAVVRPIPASASAKPHVVSPTSFNHAQEVADKFKANQPVLLNLQGADRDLARRLIDFSSGLCYGLGGHMEKVAHQVYLLTPTNVEVSADDRRRLQERGLHDA
jgi:cell division inhibitor SepF